MPHHRFYNRRAWRNRARRQALNDAGYQCQRCGVSLIGLGRGAHVHHRKELKRAPVLGLEPLNLIALCRSCHTREHNEREISRIPICNVDGTPNDPAHPWY